MINKKISRTVFAVALLLVSSMAFSLSQRQVGDLLEKSTAKVSIYMGNQLLSFGSGFLLSKKGLIGTNMHVVDQAMLKNGQIYVEFIDKKEKYLAQLVNWDSFLDFAILKINATSYKNLRALDVGNSNDLKSLDSIYVAGFPVTGIFKAQKGEVNSFQKLYGKNYIDISVPIDKGNSGGPIVDTDGDLIGVSVAFLTTARSMNLAIPVSEISDLIERTIDGGYKQIIQDGREREDNNSKNVANFITQGLLIEGFLDEKDQVDWFEIAGQEGYNPRITIAHGKLNNFDFEVYSDANLVCKAVGSTELDGVQCSVPGRCFIKVYKVSGSGNYSIQISSQQKLGSDDGREQEPNNTKEMANATKVMNLIGALDINDAIDWFQWMGQGGPANLIISHSAKADYNFEVYNDNGVICSALGKAVPDKVSCTLPPKCYIKVWRLVGEGSYVIRIEGGSTIPKK